MQPFALPSGMPSPIQRRKKELFMSGFINRILQMLARVVPGAKTCRVFLHKCRGVHIGRNVWIGYDVVIETSAPYLVNIRDNVVIGIRATIIAHFRELNGVTLEEDAFIGPGALIMPGVVIGRGAVVTAGSVVTRSVPPMTVVQGNPASTVATNTLPLGEDVTVRMFSSGLRPHKIDQRVSHL